LDVWPSFTGVTPLVLRSVELVRVGRTEESSKNFYR
jgi:hypothetical protein